MSWLRTVWDELYGMFVDDSTVAVLAAMLIAAVAIAVKFAGLPALFGGALLLAGCIAILARGVLRR